MNLITPFPLPNGAKYFEGARPNAAPLFSAGVITAYGLQRYISERSSRGMPECLDSMHPS